MSTHIIGFYEDLTKIIFELSSNIFKYAPYFFCCTCTKFVQLTPSAWSKPVQGYNNWTGNYDFFSDFFFQLTWMISLYEPRAVSQWWIFSRIVWWSNISIHLSIQDSSTTCWKSTGMKFEISFLQFSTAKPSASCLRNFWNFPKFSDRQVLANNADQDQSSLIKVYTVCYFICLFHHHYSNVYRTLQCITRTFFTQTVLCKIWSALYSGTPNFELFSRSLKVEKTSYNC